MTSVKPFYLRESSTSFPPSPTGNGNGKEKWSCSIPLLLVFQLFLYYEGAPLLVSTRRSKTW